MLAVLIIPAAFCAIFAASAGRPLQRFLRVVPVFGIVIWCITEGLSGLNELRRVPLLFSWCAVAIIAAAFAIRQRARARNIPAGATQPDASHGGWLGALSALAVAAILAGTLLTAAVSPPNSADAMAYHAPRVLYWAEQSSVRFFPTPYLNQIMLQPFAEYVNLHTYLLAGSDRFFNLSQCVHRSSASSPFRPSPANWVRTLSVA